MGGHTGIMENEWKLLYYKRGYLWIMGYILGLYTGIMENRMETTIL